MLVAQVFQAFIIFHMKVPEKIWCNSKNIKWKSSLYENVKKEAIKRKKTKCPGSILQEAK